MQNGINYVMDFFLDWAVLLFAIVGSRTSATLTCEEIDRVDLRDAIVEARRIAVRYAEYIAYPAGWAGFVAPEETYWRATDAGRAIVKLAGAFDARGDNARYTFTRVEQVKSQS